MVRIRLRRVGRKKAPVYRIVVADSKSPRDGKFIEIIGQYDPRKTEGGLSVKEDRANYWLNVGAQPSDTARSLLRRAGVLKRRHEARLGYTPELPLEEQQPDLSNVIPVREDRDESGETREFAVPADIIKDAAKAEEASADASDSEGTPSTPAV